MKCEKIEQWLSFKVKYWKEQHELEFYEEFSTFQSSMCSILEYRDIFTGDRYLKYWNIFGDNWRNIVPIGLNTEDTQFKMRIHFLGNSNFRGVFKKQKYMIKEI